MYNVCIKLEKPMIFPIISRKYRYTNAILDYFPPVQTFLRGETQIPTDEAFQASVTHYNNVFLKSERIAQIVAGGALSHHDCREVFK